jgi:hypothetical protein
VEGTGQGISGLYDLLTPGKGTNRFSKSLTSAAEATDLAAKEYKTNPIIYHGSQAVGDIIQATMGGSELKYLAKGAEKVPGAVKVVRGATGLNNKLVTTTEKLATKGTAGKVGAKVVSSTLNPKYQATNLAVNSLYQGQQASQGRKVTAGSFGTGVGVGAALPVAGVAGKYAAKQAVKVPQAAINATWDYIDNHAHNALIDTSPTYQKLTQKAVDHQTNLENAIKTGAPQKTVSSMVATSNKLTSQMRQARQTYIKYQLSRLAPTNPEAANWLAMFVQTGKLSHSVAPAVSGLVYGKGARGFAKAERAGRTFTTKETGTGLKVFERSDKNAKINTAPLRNLKPGQTVPLSKVLSHPELFKQYPGLKNFPIGVTSRSGIYGTTRPTEGQILLHSSIVQKGGEAQARSTLLHELQHGIGLREGMPMRNVGVYSARPHEVVARNIQTRRDMSQTELNKTPFKSTYDMPSSGNQLRFGGKLHENFTKEGNPAKGSRAASVSKTIVDALNGRGGARAVRRAQEKGYTTERGRRFAKGEAMAAGKTGLAAYKARRAAMFGKLPKKAFEPLIALPNKLKNDAHTMVERSAKLSGGEKLAAGDALARMFGEEQYAINPAVPQESQIKLLERVFGKEVGDSIRVHISAYDKIKSGLAEAANIPRSLMSSYDVSGGFRQGLFLGLAHPVNFAKEYARAFTYIPGWGEKGAGARRLQQALDDISKHPDYKLLQKARVAMTAHGSDLAGREEKFASQLADKIPGVGASSRNYVGFLNTFRARTFYQLLDKARQAGINVDDERFLRDLGKVINTGTGRGSLGKFEGSATFLNTLFFSPRLAMSRLQVLNPAYYITLNPFARREALKQAMGIVGFTTGVLGLAKMAGASVGADPRNADFGKIKIGNTRVDTLGGLQQYIRFISQMATGKIISSTTGKEITLGSGGFGKLTQGDIAERFIRSKTNPIVGMAWDLLYHNNAIGQPLTGANQKAGGATKYLGAGTYGNDIVSHFIPLLVQDMSDIYNDQRSKGGSKGQAFGTAALGGLVGGSGFGLQTYSAKQPGSSSASDSGVSGSSLSGGPTTTSADAIQAALKDATVTFNGKKTKWLDLSADQQKQLAGTDQTAYGLYKFQQSAKVAFAANKLYPPNLSPQSRKTLDYFDHLTTTGKNNVEQRDPAAEYALKAAQFEVDKLNGKFTDDSQLMTAQKSLAKTKVGADTKTPKSTRDLYGHTKGDIEDYLTTHNDQTLYNQLIAYDDALFNAGLISSHKFRNKYGTITLSVGSANDSSKSGSSSGSGYSSRGRSGRSISVSKYTPSFSVKAAPSRAASLGSGTGAKVAIKKYKTSASGGKIKVSTIKNTT